MGKAGEHEGRPPLILDRVLYGASDLVARWIESRIPGYTVAPESRCLGVVRDGKMAAAVAYERWNGVHCEVSIAAEPVSWASRPVLHRLFRYPFGDLDCVAISCMVPMSNLPSMNLATKLGFEPEAIVRFAAADGSDLLILKQWRETCRWLRHGTVRRQQQGAEPA